MEFTNSCGNCWKSFRSRQTLARHCRSSCKQKQIVECYECPECRKKFERKDILARHIQCRHTFANKSFECPLCPQKFILNQHLSSHFRQKHLTSTDKKKPAKNRDKIICNRCYKTFTTYSNLIRHNRTVHDRIIREKGNPLIILESLFECDECNKKFTRKDGLLRHIKCHMFEKPTFECVYCSRSYSLQSNLKQHIRSCHSQSDKNRNKKTKVKTVDRSKVKAFTCLLCDQIFDYAYFINKHYEKDHSVAYVYECLEFASLAEFEIWMNNERKMYIQCLLKSCWENSSHLTKVFRCHRSGIRCVKAAPKRIPKLAGSKKLNGFCPMCIILKESKIDGTCSVKYQKTHVGHNCDATELPFISLSEKEKLEIANAKNVILTENESGIIQGNDCRHNIFSCTGPTNNSPTFDLNKPLTLLCKDDTLNIRSFVVENRDSILFYKVPGEDDEYFPTLKKNDFALAYMDHDQEETLRRYGHKIILLECTHCIKPNNFILHSVIVQDVDYEGYPVAFLLTNRKDQPVINILLRHIKKRVGVVKPKIIMSDTQNSYFNAWIEEMGPAQKKLYCAWHVYESWRKNYSKINCKELRQIVKKEVEDLSRETDEKLFLLKLDNLMRNDDKRMHSFLNYFRTYVNNKEYWAYCYRKLIRFSTNVRVERFHRTFTDRNKTGIKILSVNECFSLLKQYLNWKKKDIKKKSIGGNIGHKTKVLRRRHKAAEKLCASKGIFINRIDRTCWRVESFEDTGDNTLFQELHKLEVKECAQYSDIVCSLPCTKCKICHHDFVCTCPDNTIRNYTCEHIHILGMYLLNEECSENDLAHEDFKQKEACVEEDFYREEIVYVEHDFDGGETKPIEEDFDQEMMLVSEDFVREETVHTEEDFDQNEISLVEIDFSRENFINEEVHIEDDFKQENLTIVKEDIDQEERGSSSEDLYQEEIALIEEDHCLEELIYIDVFDQEEILRANKI